MIKTPFFRAAVAIARKDIRAEFRSRELISLMGLFALLSILVFSFALELNREVRVEAVGGVLWVTILFASILGLNRSMTMEREGGGMDALLLAPIDRAAVFVGKLAANGLFALLVGVFLMPILSALYNVSLLQPVMFGALALGTFGLATIGTLLAALIGATRARESLLPVLMLPLALPILITVTRATNAILSGTVADSGAWLSGLLVVDIVYAVMCAWLFEIVAEE
ncbi:MAG: heme exporter protein CcmB [Chloroflexota bacterium]|nr:heme exporter protein CcmB [Chloroflexota bacterium]